MFPTSHSRSSLQIRMNYSFRRHIELEQCIESRSFEELGNRNKPVLVDSQSEGYSATTTHEIGLPMKTSLFERRRRIRYVKKEGKEDEAC